MKYVLTSLILVALVTPACHAVAPAAPGEAAAPVAVDGKDKPIVDAFCRHALALAAKITDERIAKRSLTPEDLCWVEMRWLNMSLTAYQLTGDVKYLNAFVRGMDVLLKYVTKNTDGEDFRGWYGRPVAGRRNPDKPVHQDELQTSYRAVGVMARFCELTSETPHMKKAFAGRCREYLDLCEELVAKWDERGSYKKLPNGTAIYRLGYGYAGTKAGVSGNFEKISIMVEGLVNLYRATGEDQYLVKAVELGSCFKHCLKLAKDAYWWNTWEPLGAWDMTADGTKWNNWINAEPVAAWYNSSVKMAVLLYHHGVVFDATDMKRFANTQTKVCWNGDFEKPRYRNTKGAALTGRFAKGVFMSEHLAPFDASVARFVYDGPIHAFKLKNKDSDWHNGPLSDDWIITKYLVMPRARDGRPAFAETTESFRASADGEALLAKLHIDVEEPGYQTPATPPAR